MGLLILNCRQAIALQRCPPTGTGVALSVLFMLGNLLLTLFEISLPKYRNYSGSVLFMLGNLPVLLTLF